VTLMTLMLQKAAWKPENMARSLRGDFSNATDLADDLALKGVSFRDAHEIVGHVVQWCIQNKKILEDLTLAELKSLHKAFDEKSLAKLAHKTVMQARTSVGGTSAASVKNQIVAAHKALATR
jgi:argininosuccinate lyase